MVASSHPDQVRYQDARAIRDPPLMTRNGMDAFVISKSDGSHFIHNFSLKFPSCAEDLLQGAAHVDVGMSEANLWGKKFGALPSDSAAGRHFTSCCECQCGLPYIPEYSMGFR